ncbi:MAG: alpha/beta fold hydrolase [Fuerstiella sp.]
MSGTVRKFDFQNALGDTLSGKLELPYGKPSAVALFAHCFSCNKNVHAAARISRSLREQGVAVLRFDFTGLGLSEGDFANTNFSSNRDDLRSAVAALNAEGYPPSILIGHSLGGAASLYLAGELEQIGAVVSIGSPSEPAEVLDLLGRQTVDEVRRQGQTQVRMGDHSFQVKSQFLDDVSATSLKERLSRLKKPALIIHGVEDKVVSIQRGRDLFLAASASTSFVALDGADHMLSRKADSQQVAKLVVQWAQQNVLAAKGDSAAEVSHGTVVVSEVDGGLTQFVTAGSHTLVADEPVHVPDGHGDGMTPYDLLLAGLGACTSMTLRMYAKRKQWNVRHIAVHLEHDKVHASDCQTCEDQDQKIDRITRRIRVDGDLTTQQQERLLQIADMCPVHRSLIHQKEFVTTTAIDD